MRFPIILLIIFSISISLSACRAPANEAVPECEDIVVNFLAAVKSDRMETAKSFCFNSYIDDHLDSLETVLADLTVNDFHSGDYSYTDADPDGWTSRYIEITKVEVSQNICVFQLQKDNNGEWKIFSHKLNYIPTG